MGLLATRPSRQMKPGNRKPACADKAPPGAPHSRQRLCPHAWVTLWALQRLASQLEPKQLPRTTKDVRALQIRSDSEVAAGGSLDGHLRHVLLEGPRLCTHPLSQRRSEAPGPRSGRRWSWRWEAAGATEARSLRT